MLPAAVGLFIVSPLPFLVGLMLVDRFYGDVGLWYGGRSKGRGFPSTFRGGIGVGGGGGLLRVVTKDGY